MARRRSVEGIEKELNASKAKVDKLEARLNAEINRIKALQEERDMLMGHEIARALKKSRKSYEQVLVFLGVR